MENILQSTRLLSMFGCCYNMKQTPKPVFVCKDCGTEDDFSFWRIGQWSEEEYTTLLNKGG